MATSASPTLAVERIDADDQLAAAIAAGLDRRPDLVARRRLGVGGDRILEVEDQPVGGQGAPLFECAGVRAGHVKHAAAGADRGWHG
jgi:hypothetical protein